jgi:hypothetical protein
LVGSSIFCCDALLLGLFASVRACRRSWGLVVSLVVGSTYQSVLLVRCRFYLVLLAAVTLFSWWSCSSSSAELPGCVGVSDTAAVSAAISMDCCLLPLVRFLWRLLCISSFFLVADSDEVGCR